MKAQDIIDFVESHNREEGDAYLDSLFDRKNLISLEFPSYSNYYPRNCVAKDKVCLVEPDMLHFPWGEQEIDRMLYCVDYNEAHSAEANDTIALMREILPAEGENWETFNQKFDEYRDISSVEIISRICDYNNKNKESDIAERLLNAAHKNGVTWCDDIVNSRDDEYFYINALCKFYSKKSFETEDYYQVHGISLGEDLAAISKLYEYTKERTHDDYFSYRRLQPIRDDAREHLFEAIADGKTSYDYRELKVFRDMSLEDKAEVIAYGVDASESGWEDDGTNVLETDAYKRAMHRIEYEIIKGETFETKEFSNLSEEQKNLILEFTDSKEIAKAIIESYKGDVSYSDLIAKHFTEDEFETIIADCKVAHYRHENDKLKAQMDELRRNIAKDKSAMQEERATSVNANEDLQSLTDTQRRENFVTKKKLMTEKPVMLEPCLNSMCTAYVLTEDEELKKEMLSDLYAIRKGAKTDAQKRDTAKAFKRVLDKNPKLKEDKNLVALSKIDTVVAQPTKTVKKQVTR